MEKIIEYLPFLIPIILLELVLAFSALIHLLKHPDVKFGNKTIWIFVVLLLQIIGPILYFTIGRSDQS